MKIPTKLDLIIGGVVLVFLVMAFLVVKSWHHKATVELPAAREEIGSLKASAKLVAKQSEVTKETTNEHEAEVTRIVNPERTLQPVRVCKQLRLPTVPDTAERTDSPVASSEPGLPSGDSGRDVTIGATVYGKRCELLRAEVILWRDWSWRQHELSRETEEHR